MEYVFRQEEECLEWPGSSSALIHKGASLTNLGNISWHLGLLIPVTAAGDPLMTVQSIPMIMSLYCSSRNGESEEGSQRR